MLAAEEDVAGGEAETAARKRPFGVQKERVTRRGAGGHEGDAGTDLVAEGDDAVEVVEGDAEERFAGLPDVDGGAVLGEVDVFAGDEEGVEVGLHGLR